MRTLPQGTRRDRGSGLRHGGRRQAGCRATSHGRRRAGVTPRRGGVRPRSHPGGGAGLRIQHHQVFSLSAAPYPPTPTRRRSSSRCPAPLGRSSRRSASSRFATSISASSRAVRFGGVPGSTCSTWTSTPGATNSPWPAPSPNWASSRNGAGCSEHTRVGNGRNRLESESPAAGHYDAGAEPSAATGGGVGNGAGVGTGPSAGASAGNAGNGADSAGRSSSADVLSSAGASAKG